MFVSLSPGPIGLGALKLPVLVELAQVSGFQGLDLPISQLADEEEAKAALEHVQNSGLRWALFSLPSDLLRVSQDEFDQGLRALRPRLPLVKAAGCTRTYNHVWPGSDERPWAENWAWHAERIHRLADLLGQFDVRLGLEFIGPKTLRRKFAHPFVHDLAEVVELADAVGPHVGIVLDSFHWYTSHGTLTDVRHYLQADRIINVHVNDAVPTRSADDQIDTERAMPLETGMINSPALLRLLAEMGYQGPVIAEPFEPTRSRYRATAPESVAREVSDTMRRLFAQAGMERIPAL